MVCYGAGSSGGVPPSEDTWQKAYKKYKADMTKAGLADKLPEPPGPLCTALYSLPPAARNPRRITPAHRLLRARARWRGSR